MLKSCECYNINTNQWKYIPEMSKSKCAFAATTVLDQYIYVIGGFDGKERLKDIEVFDINKK